MAVRAPLMFAVVVLSMVLPAGAAGRPTDLGPPMSIQTTNPYLPLSGFHRIGSSLRQGRLPEFLFLGAQGAGGAIDAERWPVVKALDQFGTLAGVTPVERRCNVMSAPGPGQGTTVCTIPTFDFTHARYTSPYLMFTSRDLVRLTLDGPRLLQRLSPQEMRLFNRYSRYHGPVQCARRSSSGRWVLYPCTAFTAVVTATISNASSRTLPLLVVGNYLQTQSQLFGSGDLQGVVPNVAATPAGSSLDASSPTGLPFETVRLALVNGKSPPGTNLVADLNAEANIITALICHADGLHPTRVCRRPAIRGILKHVR